MKLVFGFEDLKDRSGRQQGHKLDVVVFQQLFHFQFQLVLLFNGLGSRLVVGGFNVFMVLNLLEYVALFFAQLAINREESRALGLR